MDQFPQLPLWLVDGVREKKAKAAAVPARHASPSASRSTAYGEKALLEEVHNLAAAPKGQRDNTRNGICFRIGKLVAGGHLAHDDAVDRLVGACETNGLIADDGYDKTRNAVIRSLDDGMASGAAGPDPHAARTATAPREEERPWPEDQKHVGNGHANGAVPPGEVLVPDGVSEPPPDSEHLTDIGNGDRIVRLFGHDVRWASGLGWLVWNGSHWREDGKEDTRVRALAKESAVLMREEIHLIPDPGDREHFAKHARKSEALGRVTAAVEMARCVEAVRAEAADFDSDPYLFNVKNGTVNLKTGELRPHKQSDLIMHQSHVAFDAAATCPIWDAFIDQTYGGSAELISFVQRAVGYTLTGITSEQCFFILHGEGSNGKSTILKVLLQLFGSGYGRSTAFETFLASKPSAQGAPRPDLVRLAGARLVTAVEPPQGSRFSEAVIKSITGGDPIVARNLFFGEIEFTPALKLWFSVNHRPRVSDTSHAMWRRIREIPHDHVIADDKQDKKLFWKLLAELPGILNWAIRGCLEWQVFGLPVSKSVEEATAEYKDEEDVVGNFLAECTEKDPIGVACAGATALYGAYRAWATESGYGAWSKVAFGKKLTEKRLHKKRKDTGWVYEGLRITKHGTSDTGGRTSDGPGEYMYR